MALDVAAALLLLAALLSLLLPPRQQISLVLLDNHPAIKSTHPSSKQESRSNVETFAARSINRIISIEVSIDDISTNDAAHTIPHVLTIILNNIEAAILPSIGRTRDRSHASGALARRGGSRLITATAATPTRHRSTWRHCDQPRQLPLDPRG